MTEMAARRWQAARRILVVRLDSLGDVLMTTPAFRALAAGNPDRKLTLLTSPAGAAAAALIPEIDDVIVYEAPWMKATAPRSSSQPDLEMADRLRQSGFDAAVIFTVFSQNPLPAAFLAYLADIPLRLAYARENPYQLLTDWVPEVDPDPEGNIRHEVRRHLDLVAAVGCRVEDERMSIRVPQGAHGQVKKRLNDLGVDLQCPWVVIHPGASAPSRRYRPDGFASAARSLIRQHGWQVIFTGRASEAELVEEIRRQVGEKTWSLVDQLDLGEFSALVKLAPLLITNNTGPAHIAAAVGTPVVDLYALTNPQHTPWQVPSRVLYHDVPCKNCFKSICPLGHQNCLSLVPPESVVQAALELWQETMKQIK